MIDLIKGALSMNMFFKKKKGQSTVEYLLMMAAAIGLFIVFLNPGGGVMYDAFNAAIDINLNSMVEMSNKIFN